MKENKIRQKKRRVNRRRLRQLKHRTDFDDVDFVFLEFFFSNWTKNKFSSKQMKKGKRYFSLFFSLIDDFLIKSFRQIEIKKTRKEKKTET